MKALIITNILLSFYYINCNFPFFNILQENETKNTTKTTYIYGHLSPDTDTIASSIILADFLKKMGNKNKIVPCRLGEINKETKYILKYCRVQTPILIKDLSGADEVFLVDHNSPSQSLDFNNANIIGLIDHHAITGFETTNPIQIITKPVGCTATILYELYKQNNISISEDIAELMISAIISDTLLLKSSITTQEDIDAVEILSNEIGMDYKNYGYSMLEAGTDISDMTENQIINLDSKSYQVNGYKIQIAFLNSLDATEVLYRKEKLLEEINKFIDKKHIHLFVLTIVNIIDLDSTVLVSGSLSKVVESAFHCELKDNEAFLKGISSRKKEVYPYIANEIKKLKEFNSYKWININALLIIFLLFLF